MDIDLLVSKFGIHGIVDSIGSKCHITHLRIDRSKIFVSPSVRPFSSLAIEFFLLHSDP